MAKRPRPEIPDGRACTWPLNQHPGSGSMCIAPESHTAASSGSARRRFGLPVRGRSWRSSRPPSRWIRTGPKPSRSPGPHDELADFTTCACRGVSARLALRSP
jgi:hypothetical protein